MRDEGTILTAEPSLHIDSQIDSLVTYIHPTLHSPSKRTLFFLHDWQDSQMRIYCQLYSRPIILYASFYFSVDWLMTAFQKNKMPCNNNFCCKINDS